MRSPRRRRSGCCRKPRRSRASVPLLFRAAPAARTSRTRGRKAADDRIGAIGRTVGRHDDLEPIGRIDLRQRVLELRGDAVPASLCAVMMNVTGGVVKPCAPDGCARCQRGQRARVPDVGVERPARQRDQSTISVMAAPEITAQLRDRGLVALRDQMVRRNRDADSRPRAGPLETGRPPVAMGTPGISLTGAGYATAQAEPARARQRTQPLLLGWRSSPGTAAADTDARPPDARRSGRR